MTAALFKNRWVTKDVVTTMIYTHVLNRGRPRGQESCGHTLSGDSIYTDPHIQ